MVFGSWFWANDISFNDKIFYSLYMVNENVH